MKIDVSVLNFLQRVFCSLYVTLEHEWNWGSLEHRKWNWSSLLLLLNIMSTNEHIHFLRYMFYKVGTYQRLNTGQEEHGDSSHCCSLAGSKTIFRSMTCTWWVSGEFRRIIYCCWELHPSERRLALLMRENGQVDGSHVLRRDSHEVITIIRYSVWWFATPWGTSNEGVAGWHSLFPIELPLEIVLQIDDCGTRVTMIHNYPIGRVHGRVF